MTHQPPLPDAATAPYPLRPAPMTDHAPDSANATAAKDEGVPARRAPAGYGAAIGTALGLGVAAALAGLFYWRRSPAKTAAPRRSRRSGDDKSKRGKADRSRVAAGEAYEVRYFARKQKIGIDEARAILAEAGPDRKAANALAARRRGA